MTESKSRILVGEDEHNIRKNLAMVLEATYPPSQKATGVNPWMNARGVPSVALAKEGSLRRVSPYEVSGRCHGRKAVGLHPIHPPGLPRTIHGEASKYIAM